MKKHLSLLLALSLVLCVLTLTSCAEKEESEGRLDIVATVFPAYDFARELTRGVSGVSLTMLLPPGNESHDFEPSLSDLQKIGEADLVICIGGESDEWIDKALEVTSSRAAVVRMTDCVTLLETDHATGEHQSKHSHSHEGAEYDEHVWTSPANAVLITEALCKALSSVSPECETVFKENCASYTKELLLLEAELQSIAGASAKETLIFADRFPFRYLLHSIGADYAAAFDGCSSDSEIPLATLYSLTEKAKRTGAKVILIGEFADDTAAAMIAAEVGGSVKRLHSCHNVSKEDFKQGVTYLSLMRENLNVLKASLG